MCQFLLAVCWLLFAICYWYLVFALCSLLIAICRVCSLLLKRSAKLGRDINIYIYGAIYIYTYTYTYMPPWDSLKFQSFSSPPKYFLSALHAHRPQSRKIAQSMKKIITGIYDSGLRRNLDSGLPSVPTSSLAPNLLITWNVVLSVNCALVYLSRMLATQFGHAISRHKDFPFSLHGRVWRDGSIFVRWLSNLGNAVHLGSWSVLNHCRAVFVHFG